MEFNCYNDYIRELDVSKNTRLTFLNCSLNFLSHLNVDSNTALRTLYCSENNITSLNVGNNTALTSLYCYRNNISALDVTHNPALTDLQCNVNQLTELDLSQNPSLQTLWCGDNAIGTLDLSRNPKLEYLYCSKAGLSELNVSTNTALIELWCYSNSIRTLDVRKNAFLKLLICYSNDLSALDVSNNTELDDLACNHNNIDVLDITSNTKITTLYCGFNPLTELNLSKNISLDVLECSGLHLEVLDLSNNRVLTGLSCEGSGLTDLDLSNNTLLTGLWVRNNSLASINLTGNPALSLLDISSNQFDHIDTTHNPELSELSCSGNRIKALDLSMNPKLTGLWCENNQIDTLNLRSNPELLILNCNSNQLSALDLTANPALSALDCSGNYLAVLDTSNNPLLLELYCSNTTLRRIDLSRNTALISLDCSYNDFTTLDLSRNTSLDALACDGNSRIQALYITSSGNLDYPFQTDMREYTGDTFARVTSVKAYNRDGAEIPSSFSPSEGTAYFASSPHHIVYGYDTGYTGNASADRVARTMSVTMGVPTRSFVYIPKTETIEAPTGIQARTEENTGDDAFTTAGSDNQNTVAEVPVEEISIEADENGNIVQSSVQYTTLSDIVSERRSLPEEHDDNESEDVKPEPENPEVPEAVTYPHYESASWTTNLTLTPRLIAAVMNNFPSTGTQDIHTLNEIVTLKSWSPNDTETEILGRLGEKFLFSLPEVRANSGGVYVIQCVFGENINPGDKIAVYNLSNNSAQKMQYIFMDENYNVIDYVPVNKRVYLALRLSSGRTGRGVVTQYTGLPSGVINAFTPDSELLEKVAQVLQVAPEDVKFLDASQISEAQEPSQSVTGNVNAQGMEIVGKLGTLTVSAGGSYVFRVVMSDQLYDMLINRKRSAYMFCVVNPSGTQSLWEALTMSGEILETFSSMDFLMAGEISAGGTYSLYLAVSSGNSGSPSSPVSSSGSGGGCDSGVGLCWVIVCAGIILRLGRKNRLAALCTICAVLPASCLCAEVRPSDYTLPVDYEVYTLQGKCTTNFALTPELAETIAKAWGNGMTADRVHPFSEVALPGSWDVRPVDFYNVAREGQYAIAPLPIADNWTSGDVYVLMCTFSNDVNTGELISVLGFNVSKDARISDYQDGTVEAMTTHMMFDENLRRTDGVPAGRKVYAAISLTTTNSGLLTVIRGRYVEEADPLARLDPDVAQRIADNLGIPVEKLKYLTRANIGAPREATETMRDYVTADGFSIIADLFTVSVDSDGWYVNPYPVTLSDDVWELVKSQDISQIRVYKMRDGDEAENGLASGDVRGAFGPVYGMLSVFELSGGNLDDLFSVKSFIIAGFLQAGTPFSVYLAKIIIAILLGGCSNGINPSVIPVIICGIIFLKLAKRGR